MLIKLRQPVYTSRLLDMCSVCTSILWYCWQWHLYKITVFNPKPKNIEFQCYYLLWPFWRWELSDIGKVETTAPQHVNMYMLRHWTSHFQANTPSSYAKGNTKGGQLTKQGMHTLFIHTDNWRWTVHSAGYVLCRALVYVLSSNIVLSIGLTGGEIIDLKHWTL